MATTATAAANMASLFDEDENFSSRAGGLVLDLLALTSNESSVAPPTTVAEEIQTRGYQRKICEELLDIFVVARGKKLQQHQREKQTSTNGNNNSRDNPFIRTNIEYNNKKDATPPTAPHPTTLSIREALGGLPASTISQLATALTKLLTHRVETEFLLPGTQDVLGNVEALGMLEEGDENSVIGSGGDNPTLVGRASVSSGGGAKSAMTISSLGITAAQLYVELIGMKGAWGAGIVDVGGISAVSALVRRWCVECRGREPVGKPKNKTKKEGKQGKNGAPAAKRAKGAGNKKEGSRKSVRISESVAVFGGEDDDDESALLDDTAVAASNPDLNATFFVEEEDTEVTDKLTESGMILGGLKLATTLGNAPMQVDYKNWSAEARESFLDAATAALATSSALLAGCKGRDVETALICQEAVCSLEVALQSSVTPAKVVVDPMGVSPDVPTTGPLKQRKKNKVSPKEDFANKKRLQESGIYLLRGLMPILNLKMEVPNGQVGKVAAYETAASLLVTIITSISEEIRHNTNTKRNTRLSLSSLDMSGSQTPKRGGRKSISFSHTPGNTKGKLGAGISPIANLQPPSLKKSITPRRTRSSNNVALSERPALHPILSLIMGMLHKLFTTKGLERAETRSRVCALGVLCLSHFPSMERTQMIKFVGDMCESKISSHRMLGVELIGEILCTEWYWEDVAKENKKNGLITPFEKDDEENKMVSSSTVLLAALQGRLTDKSPTVRTRAAMALSEVVRKANVAQEEGMTLDGDVENTPMSDVAVSSKVLNEALCSIGTGLVDSLRRRASTDDRATVRKAAIIAWLQMLSLAQRKNQADFVVSNLDVSALCTLCNDASVATRKAAADALTKLVKANYDSDEYTPQASALEMAWAHTVLPLVSDVEVTCVTKAVEFFSSLIIEPIVELGRDTAEKLKEGSSTRYLVAWRILSKVSDSCKEAGGSRNGPGSLQTAIQKLFVNAGNDCKSLAKNLLRAVYQVGAISLCLDRRTSQDSLMSHDSELEDDLFGIRTQSMRTGAWCLLDALTSCLTNTSGKSSVAANVSLSQAVRSSNIDSSFLALSLTKLRSLSNSNEVPYDKRAGLVTTSRDCLRVIARMGSFVPLDDARACFSDLLNDLDSFNVSIDLISAAVGALVSLTKRLCDESGKDVYTECEKWVGRLLTHCENAIEPSFSSVAKEGMVGEDEEHLLLRVLFTVGELNMVGFSSQEEPAKQGSTRTNDLATEREPVRGLFVRPSHKMLQLVKLMLPNTLPMQSSTDNEMMPTPSTIRAHAFITLGKLCLRDQSLAKDCLNILARELHEDSTSDPAVQSNALMVMGDLCVRYTNLVDKYLPFMASCLQAGEGKVPEAGSESRLSISFNRKIGGYSLVKKNAILLLSSLVLQDYIKWRGLFVYRFLAAVADEDDEVSCLAQTAIRGPLLEKQPNLLATSFVESVFVLNSCKAHPIYATAASIGGSGSGVSVDFEGRAFLGGEGYHRRHEVYRMMLANMTDEQKLRVTTDLVKRVLGGALETSGDLSAVCKLSPQASTKIPRSRVVSATQVLKDTLAILASPDIKVGRRAMEDTENDDDIADGNSGKTEQRSLNKEKLLSKISRKHLMEIVIPVLCNLKSIMEGSRSPLLKDLMQYLGKIFRSFKTEVAEHLANDPTLLQELEYDTRMWEKKQRESLLNAEIVTGS